MGNMPNRWVGRGVALALGALFAFGGLLGGQAVGHRLAYGFTFDWYRHDGASAHASADVLTATGLVAGIFAVAGIALVAGPVALATRAWGRRLRYVAPRSTHPMSFDVHVARLLGALGVGLGLLAPLVAYVLLASPMLPPSLGGAGGSAIARVSPAGYETIVAWSAAAAAGLGALFAAWTSFSGVVSGRLTRDAEKNLISRISLLGMEHAKTTVALVLAVTLVAGFYASTITTNVDVADVLPRGDPNTDAAHNLTQKFKSSFTQQVTFQFHVLDASNTSQAAIYDKDNATHVKDRRTDADPSNITDEVYIRAMDEVIRFVLAQKDENGRPIFVGSVGSPDFYKLINWTLAGGQNPPQRPGPLAVDQNATYSIPDTTPDGELQYRSVQEGVERVAAVYAAVDAVTSPSWHQTAYLVTVDPKANLSSKQIGEAALRIKQAWLQKTRDSPGTFKVFGDANPPLFSVDLPLANAHASALTKHDFTVLMPVIGVFIAVTLYIAFRSLRSVVITFSMLAVAVTWTLGVMGFMRIPLNTINLAVIPLIMGVGIDYGIHMMNEYQELRAEGKTPAQAWAYAGGGSALALFVGTLTTIAGLLIMVVSPSLLVAQTGLLSAIAIASCLLLAILFVPAATTLLTSFGETRKTSGEYRPSRIMPAFATGVSRARWVVLAVLVLVSLASISSALTIRREAFGDPPRNWLPGDPLRQEHEKAIEGFYDTPTDAVKANVLIFEGDLLDPAAHRYIGNVTQTLRSNAENGTWTDASGKQHPSRVIADTLKDLPFLVNTYITVRGGVPNAVALTGGDALSNALAPLGQKAPTDSNQAYPQTRDAIKQILDETYASPLYQLANLFIDHPTYQMTNTIFSVKAATYADAEEAWMEIQDALARNDALRPEGMHASFFGNTAINYLFVAKQVPWLGYMSIGTNLAVIVIVFAFTRNLRTTLLVGACNFLSSTLWLGALTLPFVDIGLAISLTLPLIFIFCMGSDYGLHLALRCRKVGDTRLTFESVGKGVLYSFVTTIGAFLVFTQVSDLAGRRSMIATTIAIGVVFVMTLAVVPIFFPVKKKNERAERARNAPVLEVAPVEPPAAAPR